MNVALWLVFASTLIISATAENNPGVSFWFKTVTLTCPEEGDWFQQKSGSDEGKKTKSETYEYSYTDTKDLYYCKYGVLTNQTYHFYIDGKASEKSLELEAWVVIVVIVLDVIWTVLVMVIMYKCCKKSPGGAQKASKNHSRGMEMQMTDQTYQQLNPNTREATYSGINNINRTG